jgi:ABC-2 type transport system ATP-binding protein
MLAYTNGGFLMIEVQEISKSYGAIQALQDVSFQIAEGEIVGLLGPNGAGKTTTIKILTGYLHPDVGRVQINGIDMLTQTRQAQAYLGYLPENAPLYPNLSVQAYLKLMADLRGIGGHQQQELVSEAIVATGLAPYRARLIRQLSKGLRQRVGLAQAILHKPKVLILDEPTIGLDPVQIVEMRNLIRNLSTQSTILFSSHILSEVEALCDRVIIIINGHLKADARLDELSAGSTGAVMVLNQETGGVVEKLGTVSGVTGVESFHMADGYPAFRIYSENDILPQLFETAQQAGWPVRELRRDVLTLEAVFSQLATAV